MRHHCVNTVNDLIVDLVSSRINKIIEARDIKLGGTKWVCWNFYRMLIVLNMGLVY